MLRRWAGERRFQVGVQLLRCALDGAAAGSALADIAEAALAALLPRSRRSLRDGMAGCRAAPSQ